VAVAVGQESTRPVRGAVPAPELLEALPPDEPLPEALPLDEWLPDELPPDELPPDELPPEPEEPPLDTPLLELLELRELLELLELLVDDPPLLLEDPALAGPAITACERVQGSVVSVTFSPGVSAIVQITTATASWYGWKTCVAAENAGTVVVATVDDST
jgi:hypothetical protein